jgi:hypothetical protein
MRRIVSIFAIFLICSSLLAQEDRPRNLPAFDYKQLHWGFTVGLNSMDCAIKRNPAAQDFVYADVQGFQPAGFQVNIVSDLRLTDYWTLRFLPGINLGSRDVYFFDGDTYDPITFDIFGTEYEKMTIGSSFLDFPLLLKYRSERVNNYRPYVIGGISYRLDMSAKSNFDPEGDDMFRVKKSDFYLELGFGIDNYLQFFKFAPEIKLAMGLRNMMVPGGRGELSDERFAASIDGLRSFLVMVNFHFE